MPLYRKRPVVIEAVQFNGANATEIGKFVGAGMSHNEDFSTRKVSNLHITTLEGTMKADVGDWIIKGVKGEFYPCKPDIFDATYEAVI
jgi:hypothetical protein